MKSLKVLLETLNSIINTMNSNDFKVYDKENETYFINKITYCKENDKLFITFKEDK